MVRIITKYNASAYQPLLDAMHRDRKRVFIDTLRWDLPHEDERELDQFDNENAEYLVLQHRETGKHMASLRLLHTDRPHLMSEVFPFLCEAGVPRGAHIREVTRLCLSPSLSAPERLRARNALVNGLIQYALIRDVRALTGLSELGFLSQILSAGWECIPLGLPQMVEGSLVGAFQITIMPDTLRSLSQSWQCHPGDLRVLEVNRPLAA
jgi:N-acyl-L-homoserine lactone synthetase